MWRMLQADEPEDFVLATGVTAVRAGVPGTDLLRGSAWTGGDHVETDPRYFRPAEVDLLLGDPAKAKEKLGWEAETDLAGLAKIMIDHDADLARREKHATGFRGPHAPAETDAAG